MPTSYSWELTSAPLTGSPPNPGPFVPSAPSFGTDTRRQQFERGIKFANVPGQRADNVVHGGARVWHVNSVPNVYQEPGDALNEQGTYSGVIKFRFRNYRRFPVPDSVNRYEFRSSDRFQNPVFPFTGQYPATHEFFNVGVASVTYEGSMARRRSRYAADRFLFEQAIVVGGADMSGSTLVALSSSQIYFSGTGLWTTIASMPTAKSQAAGLTLAGVGVSGSGNFFVVGGTSGSFWDDVEGRRAYQYVHASGAWFPTANSASVPRRDFEVVQIPDGRVFLPGGLASSFTGSEFWDPATNTFSGTAPIPLPPLNRESYTTTLLSDGTVLVCGGRDPIDLIALRHAFRFYPTLQSWSIEPSMSVGRAGHRSIFTDGTVVVMGGLDPAASESFPLSFPGNLGGTGEEAIANSYAEIYNPNDRTWTAVPDLSRPRANAGAVGYLKDGGRVLLLGGHSSLVPVPQSDVYVLSENIFSETTSLLTGVFDIKPVLLNPGAESGELKVLVPGGNLAGAVSFSGSQLYRTTG